MSPAQGSDKGRKVLVIGLDCAEPTLVFERWRDDLPTLRHLMNQGAYGLLRSSHPPITVPAWSCMFSSKDPGQLGFYGFRNRADTSYERMRIATNLAVDVDRVWDVLNRSGRRSILVSVPQTYPVKPLNGVCISCFLTPPGGARWCWPESLKGDLAALLDGQEYMFDVHNFRTENKGWLLEQIYEMAAQHFKVIQHLMDTQPWDLFMFVDMGVDRIHHGFWAYMDPRHPRYEAGNPFEGAIHDYYVYVDQELGRLLDRLDDDTVVLVVSDHGAKALQGGFCINEWLKQQGLLVLKDQPPGLVPLEKCEVDWERTKVWGSGGYYARVFFNVQGREPHGVIPAEEYETFREEMIRRFEATTDHQGNLLGTVALKPQELYREVRNIPPDLIVYFGNLDWRSVGSLGFDAIHTFENDTGPDDANHAQDGLIILYDPRQDLGGQRLSGLQLECVAPTILRLMNVDVPSSMEAQPITV
ncbi:MAG: alkaline phosphatase family protein [Anaerolineae bacterium]|nr:alkaline phosphatase family protein [Anaerolineae bacterium]